MLVQLSARRTVSAHVIVVGNEKGGTGKSTLAMHLSVALMNFGQRVATIDLDSRQKTFTHYVENRRSWAKRCGGRETGRKFFRVAPGVHHPLQHGRIGERGMHRVAADVVAIAGTM